MREKSLGTRLAALEAMGQLVEQQAEDDGLWFLARTAPEAYLQRALRRLHAAVETALAEYEEQHERSGAVLGEPHLGDC